MPSLRFAALITVIACAVGGVSARADHQPVFVVSGKAGVPVIMNGRNVTGAVIFGDWGLYRPGAMAPIIVPMQSFRPAPRTRHRTRRVRRVRAVQPFLHYFPGGRLTRPAVKAPEAQSFAPPKPAESYSREWTTDSAPTRADVAPAPPIVIAPNIELPRKRSPAGPVNIRPRP